MGCIRKHYLLDKRRLDRQRETYVHQVCDKYGYKALFLLYLPRWSWSLYAKVCICFYPVPLIRLIRKNSIEHPEDSVYPIDIMF